MGQRKTLPIIIGTIVVFGIAWQKNKKALTDKDQGITVEIDASTKPPLNLEVNEHREKVSLAKIIKKKGRDQRPFFCLKQIAGYFSNEICGIFKGHAMACKSTTVGIPSSGAYYSA